MTLIYKLYLSRQINYMILIIYNFFLAFTYVHIAKFVLQSIFFTIYNIINLPNIYKLILLIVIQS